MTPMRDYPEHDERESVTQTSPDPLELRDAVYELRYLRGWKFDLTDRHRGQGCSGLTLDIYPNKPDAYHPEQHVATVFIYPVPAASFNRESWEEWLWDRIAETEDHERAENFRFGPEERRPFKPAHADGWNPGGVRTVVSESVTNTPNAGRLVQIPCANCRRHHQGGMGEHFTIAWVRPTDTCTWNVPRQA